MDIEETITTFFGAIFADYEGFVCIGWMSGSNPDNVRAIDSSHFFEWPAEYDKAIDFCVRNSFRDVYVSPMLFSEQKRGITTASLTPVLWADADDCHPSNFEVPPSLSLETSPDRWHCFWLLDDAEAIEPSWASGMSKNVAYRHRDEGAGYEGWQLGKYLRVPGTMNTKPGLEEEWRVRLSIGGEIYTQQQLTEVYGEPGKAQRYIPNSAELTMPDIMPKLPDVLARLAPNSDRQRMMHIKPRGEWSETLFALECSLFREGLSAAEVFVIVKGCACDKFTRDGRPDSDLWNDVAKASREYMNIDVGQTPGIITASNEGTYTPPPAQRPSLLSDRERELIAGRLTFIDRYVAWAKTRTRADPGYHEFSAMSLLAVIFADFAHLAPRFGKMKLNMWFMILGVTTRTYKTTSKNLMEEILDPLNDPDVGYSYKLGGDVTSEALITNLSEKPHRSVLFSRDEISGLFGEVKGGKSYMSGLTVVLTELYDGKVRARKRMTGAGKDTPETSTAFNMYVCGVPGKVSEIMTPDDFATGFMARFLYVIGEPEPMTRATSIMEQASETEGDSDADPIAKNLRAELGRARKFWSNRAQPGDTKVIRVDDDAWNRWNDAVWEMAQLAAKEDQAAILEPSTNRLTKQILKLAALLAMADQRDRVGMTDMLIAIEYSEKWYQTMVQMCSMIQTSEWSRKVQTLLDFVKKKSGSVAWSAAVRAMSLPPKEFQDLVFGAADARLLNIVPDEKGVRHLVIES